MTEKTEIVVRLLALADALFLPQRKWSAPLPSNSYVGRKRFRAEGIPLVLTVGAGMSARQRSVRALAKLSRDGMLTIVRVRQSRFPSVRLSDEGDRAARRTCGLPGLLGAWLTVQRIAKLSAPPGSERLLTDVWVPETSLCADPAEPREGELSTIELMEVPALIRGWVVSRSNSKGGVYYALTNAGRAALADGAPDDDDLDVADVDDEARRFHQVTLLAELRRLESDAPQQPREIGEIPLPCSTKGMLLGPWRPPT